MFSRFRGLVWTSVLAVAYGLVSIVAAFAGASVQIVVALGVFGLILASMAPRA
jgi:hypothetical protein